MISSDCFSVRKAVQEDIDQVKVIADANRNALGFLLRATLLEGIMRGWVLVAEGLDSEIIGFVHYRHRKDTQTTLYDICVKSNSRQKGIGKHLIHALTLEMKEVGKNTVRLKSPSELGANIFYQKLGFQLVDVEKGKKRSLNIWELQIQ